MPSPTPPKPAPTTPVISQIAFTHAHLASAANKGLPLSMHCAKACHGTVKVTIAAATAKRLHLANSALTLTSGHFSAAAGRTATIPLKLSRRLATKIRKLNSLAVTVTVTPSGATNTITHLTLHH
jgi:hypothetical protein